MLFHLHFSFINLSIILPHLGGTAPLQRFQLVKKMLLVIRAHVKEKKKTKTFYKKKKKKKRERERNQPFTKVNK